jgi:hypothetical protein
MALIDIPKARMLGDSRLWINSAARYLRLAQSV